MSDEGEKVCPLCAEEMDLTDQQLKPCKCGYGICVWCWHHIMDMAEKDETEGRCPACRTPYDKEKIVRMAASCERLVAEISTERKKLQKAKSKTSEGRKQLSSVRVVQRNLVYVIGLPLNLADEDLLQRIQYFGQYGKVLKVSISRTSTGAIQQFQNSTCSVYITYSKEEEAVRCIQAVHGFMLEGRCLRACFGTTKYCHAWLRNMACNNPDCLYLHGIGSQEDSFTKDEVISAYTRSRVQQITGVTNNMQNRSGNVLPPPLDDSCSTSSALSPNPAVKNFTNVLVSNDKASAPPNSTGRTGSLPPTASWGARTLSGQSSGGSILDTVEPSKHKPEASTGLVANTAAVLSNTQPLSLDSDVGKKFLSSEVSDFLQSTSKLESTEDLKHHDEANPRKAASLGSLSPSGPASVVSAGWLQNNVVGTKFNCKEAGISSGIALHDGHSNFPSMEKGMNALTDGKVVQLSAEASSISVDKRINNNNSMFFHCNGLSRDNLPLTGSHGLHQQDANKFGEQCVSPVVKVFGSSGNMNALQDAHGWRSDAILGAVHNMESEMLDMSEEQMHINPPVSSLTIAKSPPSINLTNFQFRSSQQHANADDAVKYDVNPPVVHKNASSAANASVVSKSYQENFIISSPMDDKLLSGEKGSQMKRFVGDVSTVDSNHILDIESSIISNILSLDLDGWDESLTSQNVAKLLDEPDKHGSYGVCSSWKAQNGNQSRFLFARRDESRAQSPDAVLSFNNSGEGSTINFFSQEFREHRKEEHGHSFDSDFGLHQHNTMLPDNFFSSHSGISLSKSSVTRAHISVPPGFSMPSRQPPPGFSSYERGDPIMNVKSGAGNHLLDASSLVRNFYQISPGGKLSIHEDIEFLDPAIMAIGKGRLSGSGKDNIGLDIRNIFPSLTASEDEIKAQSFVHSSASPYQNHRYTNTRDGLSVENEAYSYASQDIESLRAINIPISQSSLHQPGNTVMSNGHWDAWSELQAGNGRLGFNKLYGGYGDPQFQMPSSANMYKRTCGM